MGKKIGLIAVLLLIFMLTGCEFTSAEISCSVNELIQAINTANNNPDHSVIILDEACIYNLTDGAYMIDFQEDMSDDNGFTGLPPISTPITIEGNDATIQRLNSADEMRFFYVKASGELTLRELTLSNGLVQTGQIGQRNGGAIFNRGMLNLVRSHVLSSYAEDSAGGIYNASVGTVHIDNSSISYNHAGAHGGAIVNAGSILIDGYSIINYNQANYTAGAILNKGDLTITGSHVSFNQAEIRGGAISTGSPSTNSFEGVLFEGNQTGGAGGGALHFIESNFSISDCTFSENQTTESTGSGGGITVAHSSGDINNETAFMNNSASRYGGGVFVYGDSTLSINNVNFQGNTAGIGGGGLANFTQDMTVDVLNSTFSNNNALMGGGVNNSGRISVEKSLITGNTSVEAGAGIYNSGLMFKLVNSTVSGNSNQNVGGGLLNYGSMKILFSTIAFNQSMHGAGLYDNGDGVQIKNSILSNNTPFSCSVFGPITTLGDNLDDDGSCQGFNLTANPFLDTLADNGGPTLTHSFLFLNPAVDGVTDCTNIAGSSAINWDQRDFARPFHPQCDLGAYEETYELTEFHAIIQVDLELIDCLEGPGDNFNPRASFFDGDALIAMGRNDDGRWIGVRPPEEETNEVFCWVPREGLQSEIPVDAFPVLALPAISPEPSDQGFDRCALFSPETYSLTMMDIPYGTGDLTLYIKFPEGVPGLEVEIPEDLHPWIYSGVLGEYQDETCTFDGYAGRLYCRFELPEKYFGTVRELNIYVNRCEAPIFSHAMVTIVEPAETIACTSSLTESECLASGGTYSCGASSDCECVCP